MRYRNPPIPALQAPENERREFFVLLAMVGGILLLLTIGSTLLAGWLAPYIPFSAEKSLASSFVRGFGSGTAAAPDASRQASLEALTNRLAKVMALPPEMSITVHYIDQPVINAAATLGGHLFVYRGLIEKLKSEDALAAVLAHEIGHVRERHVIKAMGRGIAVLVALRAVGVKSQALSEWLMGETAELTALSFSRDAERSADAHALAAVQQLYGHVGGVMDLFAFFSEHGGGGLEILKTHPLPENRRAELMSRAIELGFAVDGERRPMPTVFNAAAGNDKSR